ncbi:MAG TPA: AraC family transcriptional regulator [Pyrinomonadaceae bacterium]|nr:AraC family transcriptional regulator [Pyrinomonadaceae bacterium]
MKSAKKKQSNYTVTLAEGGQLARRQTSFLDDGSYLFQDALTIKGTLTAEIITCAAWLFEFYRLTSGEVSFLSAEKRVRPGTRVFGISYPPFTISRIRFKSPVGILIGLAGTHSLPSDLPDAPHLFDTDLVDAPTSSLQAIDAIRGALTKTSVPGYPDASLLSLKAKQLIDKHYCDYPSISRIARRLAVTPEHLSRQFKSDFGSSPSKYLIFSVWPMCL